MIVQKYKNKQKMWPKLQFDPVDTVFFCFIFGFKKIHGYYCGAFLEYKGEYILRRCDKSVF